MNTFINIEIANNGKVLDFTDSMIQTLRGKIVDLTKYVLTDDTFDGKIKRACRIGKEIEVLYHKNNEKHKDTIT